MEKLITDMMVWANVTEDELKKERDYPHIIRRGFVMGVSLFMCASIQSNGTRRPLFSTAARITSHHMKQLQGLPKSTTHN